MERKLASIKRITEILPIEGVDKIVLAKIGGWQCVVGKEDFKPGDLGVYFEIDSFLPIQPRYEFLRKHCHKIMADGSEGFRLKTMRLKKQLSQGLLMPLKEFPEMVNPPEGQDLTYILGIKLYEPPIPAQLAGKILGGFPPYIRKTDAERIQNLTEYFTIMKDVEFEETEKLNGSSFTIYFDKGEFGVCSKNLNLVEDIDNTFWRVTNSLNMKEVLTKLNRNIALQGELIGEGVQKNPYKLLGQTFNLYSIWDIDNQIYLSPIQRKDLYHQLKLASPNILHVPIISERKKIFSEFSNIGDLLTYSNAPSILNQKTKREGIVFKSYEPVNGEILIFKVINNELLLNEE